MPCSVFQSVHIIFLFQLSIMHRTRRLMQLTVRLKAYTSSSTSVRLDLHDTSTRPHRVLNEFACIPIAAVHNNTGSVDL